MFEDRVGEQRHAVGDGQLLEQAHEEVLQTEMQTYPITTLGPFDLRQEIAGADDGSGDEVWEK